jgi:hypothetical protein
MKCGESIDASREDILANPKGQCESYRAHAYSARTEGFLIIVSSGDYPSQQYEGEGQDEDEDEDEGEGEGEGQGDQNKELVFTDYEFLLQTDQTPCTFEVDSNGWTVTRGCSAGKYRTSNTQRHQTGGFYLYWQAVDDLVASNANDRYYHDGAMNVEIQNWSGNINFAAQENPEYELANADSSVNGILGKTQKKRQPISEDHQKDEAFPDDSQEDEAFPDDLQEEEEPIPGDPPDRNDGVVAEDELTPGDGLFLDNGCDRCHGPPDNSNLSRKPYSLNEFKMIMSREPHQDIILSDEEAAVLVEFLEFFIN